MPTAEAGKYAHASTEVSSDKTDAKAAVSLMKRLSRYAHVHEGAYSTRVQRP